MRIVSRQPSEQGAARMTPLSVLPVFLDLKGRRAVLAGGSEAAAWKAELLATTGAQVHVFAQTDAVCPDLVRLIGSSGDARVTHHARCWRPDDLPGAAVAVADAKTDDEARRFAEAAWAAGVPVNVIDRPEFCQFSFGSIVNRSPVVVAISTDGAAPVLAQAIRRRIETLLPPSLADWAALAQRLRRAVNDRLAPGRGRRAFWERFSDRAFGPPPGVGDETGMLATIDAVARSPETHQGRVTLVGAGPGDPELLTLKAVRALQAADVILFDDLVSDGVLELARREAKRILVGKRAGRESCRQDEISDLMVKLAKAGKHVVRLKSGDPSIFGRAGEEIDRLRAEGIGFTMVPGVTAGVAMASALGVSLTHRDAAKSVRFVTGHSRKGGLPEDLDWRAIADPSATTIFYMGGRTAAGIAARLIGLGVSSDMPVAVAAALGRPVQATARADLASLARALSLMPAGQPVVIGVGRVFAEAAEAEAVETLAVAG